MSGYWPNETTGPSPMVTTLLLGPSPVPDTPHRCPVCEGKGIVPCGFYSAIGVSTYTTSGTAPESCRSCAGTGVLWR